MNNSPTQNGAQTPPQNLAPAASTSNSGQSSPTGIAPHKKPEVSTLTGGGTIGQRDQPAWQELQCSGDIPTGRIGHTMCTTKDENTVVLYGGVNETANRMSNYLEDLFNLDVRTNTWRRIEMNGQRQQPRAFHSAVMHEDIMYIFGGCNGKGRFNKIFSIDMEGKCSVIVPTTPSPATRYCHSGVLFEDQDKGPLMYIFAGKCGGRNSNRRLSDVYRFSLHTLEWHQCQQLGAIPPSRSAHAAFTFGRSMIIFGGRNANGECCEDLYEYSYDTAVWRQINTVYGHLVGRARHSVVTHNNTIVVFGGWNGKKKLNDMFFFNLETQTFDLVTEINTQGAPSRRECHVAVMCKNTMIIFAGRFRGEFMNDTFEMKLEPKSLKANCRDWILKGNVNYESESLPDQLKQYVAYWKKMNQKQAPVPHVDHPTLMAPGQLPPGAGGIPHPGYNVPTQLPPNPPGPQQ